MAGPADRAAGLLARRVLAHCEDGMVDLLWRVVYRLGFRAARLLWWLLRPAHAGALVALWHEGQVLAVRPTYRPGLNFPGGGIRPGEQPIAAAVRELREEVGIALPATALVLAYEETAVWDFRRDHVRIFEATLPARPALRPDRREIAAACFMAPAAVLAEPIAPFLRHYLQGQGLRP
jgi:8-oxo-dGTP pyrophosphatase MutT (NUDIX family)